MKKVSVILTTYNSQSHIRRTVNSILHQDGIGTVFDIELIIVDDCSTDDTVSILKEYDIICLSTSENSGGPNKGRNLGLQASTGEYIFISDHDDEWQRNKISKMIPFLESVAIVSSGYTTVDDLSGESWEYIRKSDNQFIKFERNETFLSKLQLSKQAQNTYLSSLAFSSSLKQVKFEEHFGACDYDWVLRLFHDQESIEVCESLYVRHVDNQNLSMDSGYRLIDYYYSLMFIEGYEERYAKFVRKSRQRINGSHARYYYVVGKMKKARYHFRLSELNLKTLMYFITTFAGSRFVVRHFRVF